MATAAALICALPFGVAHADAIDSLPPGQWYEVPNSHLAALDPCPARNCSYSATLGVKAVTDAWSGAAFDTKRDRLVVWGGGHGDYAGNEVYAFDLGTLSWERLSNPSDPPAKDVPYASDGAPCSRHTYNYIQYLPPPIDRLCSFGGAAFYQSGQTGTHHVDCFNFSTNTWETQKFSDTLASNLIGSITAYDPMTGHLWQHGGLQSFLVELDPSANKWTAHGDQFSGIYLDYYKTAAIDPARRRMIAVGKGQVWSWDISATGTITGKSLTTTGATAVLAANSPGFVYDPAVDRFVAWVGGADVYTLDLDTLQWALVPPDAGNTVTPTAPNSNGTFGRFRYSPVRNVFVLVNHVDDDVFIYRLSAGGGIVPGDGGSPLPDGAATPDGSGLATPDAAGGGAQGAGCGCRIDERGGTLGAWPLLGLLGLLTIRRRRGTSGSGNGRR